MDKCVFCLESILLVQPTTNILDQYAYHMYLYLFFYSSGWFYLAEESGVLSKNHRAVFQVAVTLLT